MTIRTHSAEETYALGARLGKMAQPGQVYALKGDLGSGKTVLTKGFAAGLGVEEPVTSPTFTILMVHEGGRLPLYHYDVYRISDPDEMDEIGFDEYVYGEGVSLIEWAEKVEELLPPDAFAITIERDRAGGTDDRVIRMEGIFFDENGPGKDG